MINSFQEKNLTHERQQKRRRDSMENICSIPIYTIFNVLDRLIDARVVQLINLNK